MFTKKQKRSSRKNMASRQAKRYFTRMNTAHLSNTSVAMPVVPKSKSTTTKRASGRGN